uniref:Cellulosome anchoring protein cohesin region n=1 Tax=Panagrellus redivivus TaxID=6233 RepID=A0A7E4UTI6_PANRE
MHLIAIAFIILSSVNQCQAEVILKKGSNETVTFEGDEVDINIQNSYAMGDYAVVFCFGSTPDVVSSFCPKGYLQHTVAFTNTHNVKVNRQGQLFDDSVQAEYKNFVKFDKNGNLNIMIQEMSDGATVIMPKAEIYVPKKPVKETKQVKPNSNATVYIVIACVVVFLVALILIGVVLYFCVIRKKTNAKPMPMVIAQEENRDEAEYKNFVKFDKNGNLNVMIKKMSDGTTVTMPKAEIYVPKKPVKETKQVKPSSDATVYIVIACVVVFLVATKGFDKVQSPILQPVIKVKIEDKPKTPSMPSPILEKKSTPVKEPVNVKVKTELPTSPAKVETTESPAKAVTPESFVQPTESFTKTSKAYTPKSKSSLESAIKRRSPPTGTFSNDEVAHALSENSLYNVRGYYKPYRILYQDIKNLHAEIKIVTGVEEYVALTTERNLRQRRSSQCPLRKLPLHC